MLPPPLLHVSPRDTPNLDEFGALRPGGLARTYTLDMVSFPQRHLGLMQERQPPGYLPHRSRGSPEGRGAQPVAPAVPRVL